MVGGGGVGDLGAGLADYVGGGGGEEDAVGRASCNGEGGQRKENEQQQEDGRRGRLIWHRGDNVY